MNFYWIEKLYLICSMAFGYYVSYCFFIHIEKNVYLGESEEKNEETEETISLNSFVKELENEPMSTLTDEQLNELQNEVVTINLSPLIDQTVHMYYDHKTDKCVYYANSELIYKYLDVVARHYVLTHKCKQIYVNLDKSITSEIKQMIIEGPFHTKKVVSKTNLLEKKHLHFLYKGNYNHKPEEKNVLEFEDMDILHFLQLQKATL